MKNTKLVKFNAASVSQEFGYDKFEKDEYGRVFANVNGDLIFVGVSTQETQTEDLAGQSSRTPPSFC